jgi:hypothetical protein
MRKTVLLVAGAIAFDLGILIVAGHAAPANPLKSAKADVIVSPFSTGGGGGAGKVSVQDFHFTKFDLVNTPQACTAHNGTLVTNSAGQQACQSKQAIPGAIEILSWSWGATQSGSRR